MNRGKPIIAERIKKLRKEKGLTQEQLAEILGLSAKSSIANYESGANAPSDEIKSKMCELFNCSMDYLMGITSNTNPKKNLEKKLSEYNMSVKEYNEIKSLIVQNDYDIYSIVKSKPISDRFKIILKIFYDFYYDYDETQMISKLNGKMIKPGAVRFPEDIDDNTLLQELDKISELSKNKFKELLSNLDENSFIKDYQSNIHMTPVYGRISAGDPNWAEECIEGRLPIDVNLMNIVNPEECFFLRVNGESMNKIIKNGAYALIRKTDIVENGEIAVVLVNGFDATLKKFTKQGDLIVLEPQSTDDTFETQVYNKNTEVKIIGKYIGKMEMK